MKENTTTGIREEVVRAMRLRSAGVPDSAAAPILLIGAGCSRAAGIPLASELAMKLGRSYANSSRMIYADDAHLLKRLCEEFGQEGIDSWGAFFPFLFEQVAPTEIGQTGILREYVQAAQVNWGHACIAQLLVSGCFQTVLTTNFDLLLQQALLPFGVVPVVADGAGALARLSARPRSPQLGLLHGSITNYNVRVTRADLADSATQEQFRSCFANLLRESPLMVVVGYGGNDAALMSALKETLSTYPSKTVYWVALEKDEASLSAGVQDLLNSHKSARVILGVDSDEFFDFLLQELVADAPDWVLHPHDTILRTAAGTRSKVTRGARELASLSNYLDALRVVVSPRSELEQHAFGLAKGVLRDYALKRAAGQAARTHRVETDDPVLRAARKAHWTWQAHQTVSDAASLAAALKEVESVCQAAPPVHGSKGFVESEWVRANLQTELHRRSHPNGNIEDALSRLSGLVQGCFLEPADARERARLLGDYLSATGAKFATGERAGLPSKLVEEGLGVARSSGDWFVGHSIAINVAMIAMHSLPGPSEEVLDESLTLLERAVGDPRLVERPDVLAMAHHNCGILHFLAAPRRSESVRKWHYDRSVELLQHALRLRSICDDELRQLSTQLNLGTSLCARGTFLRSATELTESIRLLDMTIVACDAAKAHAMSAKAAVQKAIAKWNRANYPVDKQAMRLALNELKECSERIRCYSPGDMRDLEKTLKSMGEDRDLIG